jgi:hypothetical protein
MPHLLRNLPTVSLVLVTALLGIHPATAGVEAIKIQPADPVGVANCIPFGSNTDYGFTGFIWRNVPAFSVNRGNRIAFDLGDLNDRNTRRNIYLAVANKNPEKAVIDGNDVVSQGIEAIEWVQVVSEAQIPAHARGDTVIGNNELRYRVETSFDFPGGGLIAGFGATPPGEFPDRNCEQVLAETHSHDSSDYFYARFCFKDHLDMGVLDEAEGCGGTADYLGGIVISTT